MFAALRSVGWLRFAVAPLLGAVIGYITNDLALKMLFRPYEEKRIGRFRVPFTPGLIPSQKGRIAKSLGTVIAGKLLDAETLRREALSEPAMEKLRAALTDWLQTQAADARALRARLGERVPPERVDELRDRFAAWGSGRLMEKLRAMNLGELVADQVLATLRRKLEHLRLGFLIDGASEPLRASIARSVERKLAEAGPAALQEKLGEAVDGLLDKSVAELSQAQRERIPALADALLEAYRELFENHIESLLSAAHLDEIIERRINAFDARELERVIFGVAHRELRAIVYLGAMLGFLMGFVNLLF